MKRYDPELDYEWDDVSAIMEHMSDGDWVKLEDVINFINAYAQDALPNFYAALDQNRVQR